MEYQTVYIPGQIGTVSLPANFNVKMENEYTLLAYPDGPETIGLRFSSLSFKKTEDAVFRHKTNILNQAIDCKLNYQEIDDKVILTYDKESNKDGVSLLLKFWEVETKNTVIIISATILMEHLKDHIVKFTLDIMPDILKSISLY